MIRRTLLTAIILCAACTPLAADDNIDVIKLNVTPAGPPRPLLRYRFAPEARQLTEGNAAAMYYRAIVELQQNDRERRERQKLYDWLELPWNELPLDEGRRTMSRFGTVLGEIRLGTRRSRAEWDLPLKEQGVATLLPELQEMRDIARLLTIEVRVALLEKDYAKASRVLEDMYTLSQNLGESSTLIGMLVGVAAQGMATEEVGHWIGQPDSPNLYWALTSLPSSLTNLSASIESEDLWIQGSLPNAELLGAAILTPGQLERMAREVASLIDSRWIAGSFRVEYASGETQEVRVPARVALLTIILRCYPACKRQLLETDVDRELIEAMDPMQVVMLRWVQVYRELLDEMVVWARHPAIEARKAYEQIDQRFDELRDKPEAVLANVMLPYITAAGRAVLRGDQRVAMLRVVEALRLYAAAHEGQLPSTLDEIKEVPVPRDPATWGEFAYRLEGGTAVLSSTEKGLVIPDVQFEITVAKKP